MPCVHRSEHRVPPRQARGVNAHPPTTVTVASDTRDIAEIYRVWLVLSDRPTTHWATERAAFVERDRLHALERTHVEVRVVSESRVTDIPQGHDGEHREAGA
jgi:hypothetical protein